MVVATSVEDLCLDDILFGMEEPHRTLTLEEWVKLEQTFDEPIILKAVDGKTGKPINKKFFFRGRPVNVSANNGRGVQRRLAIDLLLAFGKEGKYRKKHQETGIYTMTQMRDLTEDQREKWAAAGGIKLEDWYLTHIVKPHDDEESAAAA